LLSGPFEVPPRARLVLGYGMSNAPRDPALGESAFAALLECEGRAAQRLHDERIAFGEERAMRWQSAIVDLPAPRGTRCRLRLETSGGAALLGSGVWAVPEILSRPDRAQRERRNVILISLDTLRADHLSAYGYPRATSPQIDHQLIARGARFTDVSTTYPLTNIAHMSLMTGLFPNALPRAGAVDLGMAPRLVAEVLRDSGYTTGAYTEDVGVSGMYGFAFGFDRYVERPLVGEARGTQTFADGARFLRENRDRRFFLFLHTYKVHAPYSYSQPYGELFTDAAQWSGELAPYGVPPEQHPQVDAYDRAIREVDDQVAGFLAELDRLGLSDETYVVLLSDHGDAFGEHGLTGHGFGAHQEQLQIPLVVRGPGVPQGIAIDGPASIVDVAPTIFDLLGLQGPDVQGASLRPALHGAALAQDRALLFSWIRTDAQGLRQGRWKLLDPGAMPQTLFDLAADPRERQPLDDQALIEPRRAALAVAAGDDRRRKEALSAAGSSAAPYAASERMIESMRALGYVQ
jgi:arylsulfatase A-like enzyme